MGRTHAEKRQPMTDAELAEKLELVRLLAGNALTGSQRWYLISELSRLWFPKEWAAYQKLDERQQTADNYLLAVRLIEAKKRDELGPDAKYHRRAIKRNAKVGATDVVKKRSVGTMRKYIERANKEPHDTLIPFLDVAEWAMLLPERHRDLADKWLKERQRKRRERHKNRKKSVTEKRKKMSVNSL